MKIYIMKKKLRKITQVIPVFLLVLFCSCEKENDTVNPQQRNYSIKEYSFDTASKMAKSNNAFYKISDQLSKINKLDKSTSKIEMNGIKVDSTTIREISIGDYTTYTMLVKRDEQTAGYFENIIIEVDGLEEIKTYLIKYTPSVPIEYVEAHDSYKFEGTMDAYQYPTCLACPEDDNDGENGSEGNTGSGFSSNYVCVTVMMCNQAWDNQTYGIEHIATSDCTNTYPITVCGYTVGTSGGGGGTGGTGPSGGQSGTGTGNTNSNSPTPSSPVTSPVVPKPLDEKKCALFNKLKNDAPFKDIIQILKNGVNLNYEQGVALTNRPNGTYSTITGVANPDEQYAVEFDVPNGTVIDILTHNHYTGGLTIFSPADLKQIYDYISTADVDQGDNYVSVVVTPNPQDTQDPKRPTVYAITITDRAKFIAYGNANFGTQTKFDIFDGIFGLEKDEWPLSGFGINENHTSAENEASFLKMVENSGLKVHKANADLSQWNPLKLNRNDSVLLEPSCN